MYVIQVIEENELPDGHEWAIVDEGDHITAFLTPQAVGDPGMLAEAWAGFRMLAIPRQEEWRRLRAVV